jgi:hypothetical protein
MSNTATRNRERKIVTFYWAKPIPTNKFDWTAFYDGEEESGHYGFGATEAEAIADFYEQLEDES